MRLRKELEPCILSENEKVVVGASVQHFCTDHALSIHFWEEFYLRVLERALVCPFKLLQLPADLDTGWLTQSDSDGHHTEFGSDEDASPEADCIYTRHTCT